MLYPKFFYVVITILLFAFIKAPSQELHQKITTANNYYNKQEYEEASKLYLEIYEISQYQNYLILYLRTLYHSGEYQTAEKTIKQELKKNSNNTSLKIELGYLYKRQGKIKQADSQYQKTIDQLPPSRNIIVQAGRTFESLREYEYAEAVYKYGATLPNLQNAFHKELASVYQLQRNYDAMMDKCFILMDKDPNQIFFVQNKLQYIFNINSNAPEVIQKIQSKIINQIQQTNKNIVYNELLAWLYTQQKQFSKAATITLALDKRTNRYESQIIALANSLFLNEDYTTSIELYQYILDKGERNSYYLTAFNGLLTAKYHQYTKTKTNTDQLIALEDEIEKTLSQYNNNSIFYPQIKNLARLKAYYLQKPTQAIEFLKNKIQKSNLNKPIQDQFKMILADIYLANDSLWDALLLYAQVAQDNPNSSIGDGARLKKAQISYYAGDTQWAKGQVDVIKTGTSKFTSNDAFDLSLFIGNNAQDSTHTSIKTFARAEHLYLQSKNTEALSLLDSIHNPLLTPEILYFKAQIYITEDQAIQAVEQLQELIEHYPKSLKTDNALLLLAQVYENNLNNVEQAKNIYQKLLLEYPFSVLSVEARKNINRIKNNTH